MSNKLKICNSKTCKHKGIAQPLSNFSLKGNCADGFSNECKDCVRALYTNPRYERMKKDKAFLAQFSPI